MAVEPFRGIDPAMVTRNLEAVRSEAGAGVEILVACKYVPLEEMGALAAAGVALVGENRQQDLAAKHECWGDSFTWDFIGNLQSRKVKQIVPLCRLIHSVATDSVLAQLEKHGTPETEVLIEVNVAGEEGKGGVAPDELAGLHRPLPGQGGRADDDAPVQREPRGLAPLLLPARRAGRRQRPRAALDGHLTGLACRRPGGRDDHPPGHGPVRVNRR